MVTVVLEVEAEVSLKKMELYFWRLVLVVADFTVIIMAELLVVMA